MSNLPHKTIRFLLLVFFLFIMLNGHFAYLVNNAVAMDKLAIFYVSPTGNDQWSGTIPDSNAMRTDGPFATLQRARDVIRTLKLSSTNNQFTVLVRGGTYPLNETFTLGSQDSGTESNPFTIRAYDNEKPILSGTRPVIGFTTHKGKMFRADLKGTALEPYSFRQLFAEGKRQILARFPNFDPLDPIGGGFRYAEDSVDGGSKVKFKYSEGSVHDWALPNNAEIVIYPGPNYWNNTIPISQIDKDQRIIALAVNASYSITAGNRYFFQNIMEELDAPGEWYFDSLGKLLYFWPLNDMAITTVSVPVLQTIVSMTGNYIRLEGFTLDGSIGNAITVNAAINSTIAKCTIRNTGGDGIQINNGYNNTAIGNDVYEVGGHGIYISGGDRTTLTPAGNRAENNYIHHIGVINKRSSGIEVRGVGNVVSHNLIHSTPRVGVWFDGNDHIIEYNHVHHVNQETEDSGVIYSCARDWTKRGNVVRFNYVHDSGGYGRKTSTEIWKSPYNTFGINLDDWTSGTEVFGNIVTTTCRGGILVHGGRDNNIENNIIIQVDEAQMFYSSIVSNDPILPGMFAMIQTMGYTKYPLLATITDVETGAKMSGNKFVRNIVYYTNANSKLYEGYGTLDIATTTSNFNTIYHAGLPLKVPYMNTTVDLQWTKWKESGLDQNSVIADPLLSSSFQLSPDSPALKMGFQPIPFEKIGPYSDPLRASWPLPLQDIKLHQILVN
jgi:hypothetical protein